MGHRKWLTTFIFVVAPPQPQVACLGSDESYAEMCDDVGGVLYGDCTEPLRAPPKNKLTSGKCRGLFYANRLSHCQ